MTLVYTIKLMTLLSLDAIVDELCSHLNILTYIFAIFTVSRNEDMDIPFRGSPFNPLLICSLTSVPYMSTAPVPDDFVWNE